MMTHPLKHRQSDSARAALPLSCMVSHDTDSSFFTVPLQFVSGQPDSPLNPESRSTVLAAVCAGGPLISRMTKPVQLSFSEHGMSIIGLNIRKYLLILWDF